MIWNSLRSVFVLLIFSGLVACGGFESQAKLSLTPVPSSTSSPTLTNTPEPTDTPLPTDTPAPTPTATITPTPTPQIGETRINPETGQEEVFTDPGEWVEIVKIWNIAEMGDLPRGMTKDNSGGLTKENASFEEKGETIILSWTKDWDEEAEDFGQKYELLIPAHQEDLYNSDGNKVSTELKVAFSLDGNIKPSITMISEQGETLSKWMLYEEQWY